MVGFGGDWDVWVAKLDSSGALQWNTFTGSGADESCWYGNSITTDGSGNIYVGAYSNGDWGSPIVPHSGPFGSRDAWAAHRPG